MLNLGDNIQEVILILNAVAVQSRVVQSNPIFNLNLISKLDWNQIRQFLARFSKNDCY